MSGGRQVCRGRLCYQEQVHVRPNELKGQSLEQRNVEMGGLCPPETWSSPKDFIKVLLKVMEGGTWLVVVNFLLQVGILGSCSCLHRSGPNVSVNFQ